LRTDRGFSSVEISPEGDALFWRTGPSEDDIVDLCADALWLMAHPEDRAAAMALSSAGDPTSQPMDFASLRSSRELPGTSPSASARDRLRPTQLDLIVRRIAEHDEALTQLTRRIAVLEGSQPTGERVLAKVYIEARPKGPEGTAIKAYIVEDQADRVLATFRTRREAIEWAQRQGHDPLVARVRHLNPDKEKPAHWRAVAAPPRSRPS
jgi:hypothetical protein